MIFKIIGEYGYVFDCRECEDGQIYDPFIKECMDCQGVMKDFMGRKLGECKTCNYYTNSYNISDWLISTADIFGIYVYIIILCR